MFVGLLLFTVVVAGDATADVGSTAATSSRSRAGVQLDIDVSGSRGTLTDPQIGRWVRDMTQLAADYCGRFPVEELRVEVVLRSGSRVGFGQHFGGRRVRVHVGRNASPDVLAHDHVLLHELLHTALPSLDRRHRWMREGLSTYLETMVRAQAGVVTEEEVWTRWTGSMPNGLPGWRDRGLDRTHTWGRTYWGGALFWLHVDVRLREVTQGRQTLRSLVRGVVAAGGVSRRTWPMRRLLRTADRVTHTRVFSRAYQRMALRPEMPDLDDLFARLGVTEVDGVVRFDESAGSAAVRRAMIQ